eukprot:8701339-Pyramimonas_sp.AAC.1
MRVLHGFHTQLLEVAGSLVGLHICAMRGAAFAINEPTALDVAKHCDDIAKGIQDAWSQRRSAEAFAALRRVGAGSRRERVLRGRPILKDMHAQP